MLEAGFLAGGRGELFYLSHTPSADTPVRGGVLYCHPFAEEMNKSRRMAALQARQLCAHGFHVLLLDQFGCGDSAGDFSEASWDGWLDDLLLAAERLGELTPGPPVLWGTRSGCLLAHGLLARGLNVRGLVYWQPVIRGDAFLNQFLRLRVAADMMGARGGETTAGLRSQLAGGEALEVAGYTLSPALAEGLAQTALASTPSSPLCWLEVSAGAEPALSPVGRRITDTWAGDGATVEAHAVAGEPFWTTQEVGEAPALLDCTTAFLLGLEATEWNRQPSSM